MDEPQFVNIDVGESSSSLDINDKARRRSGSQTPVKELAGGHGQPGKPASFDLQGEVGKMVWEQGKTRAQSLFNVVCQIDYLRPYFDTEPMIVLKRLGYSFIPPIGKPLTAEVLISELYGPLMVVLSLVAVLLFQMKTVEHQIREGTLIGTALFTCIGFWFFLSTMVWVYAFLHRFELSFIQCLSLVGYSLFGHCVVMLIGTIFHNDQHDSHFWFYAKTLIFVATSLIRLCFILFKKFSENGSNGVQHVAALSCVAFFHLAFLFYLHFTFHVETTIV